jgi:hypothetical protein
VADPKPQDPVSSIPTPSDPPDKNDDGAQFAGDGDSSSDPDDSLDDSLDATDTDTDSASISSGSPRAASPVQPLTSPPSAPQTNDAVRQGHAHSSLLVKQGSPTDQPQHQQHLTTSNIHSDKYVL